MKATGIVRRIDELGRVVIPKEIRRTLKIREGSPLEIYTKEDGSVVFKKYSAMGEMASSADVFAKSISASFGTWCAVSDLEKIIAVSGAKTKELQEKYLSEEMRETVGKRVETKAKIKVSEESEKNSDYVFPIVNRGDICGALITGEPASEAGFIASMKAFCEILASMQE